MAVRTNNCLICSGTDLKQQNAIVNPFIAKRVFNSKPFTVKLLKCRKCSFKFFDLRLDDNEMDKLYAGYFTADWTKERRSYEPWLINQYCNIRFNDKNYINKANMVARKLKKYIANLGVQIKSSLDFGGDNGRVISRIFDDNVEKYVYEISNSQLVPGVRKITDPSSRTYDFIMCMDVLEHVSYPQGIIEKINKAAHKETVFYFQVPYEQPDSPGTRTKWIIQQFLLLILKFKIFTLTLKKGMFTHMGEHINYFSKKSFRQLMENAGYKNIKISIETVNHSKFISCFAQR